MPLKLVSSLLLLQTFYRRVRPFQFQRSFQNDFTMSRRSTRIATQPKINAGVLRVKDEDIKITKLPSTPKKRKGSKTAASSPSPRKRSPKKTPPRTILYSDDVAKIAPDNLWQDLKVPPHELRPSNTLTTGQCFNWMVVYDDTKNMDTQSAWGTHNETEWLGPVQNFVLSIRETPSTTLYRILHGPDNVDIAAFLAEYFQLDTPLEPLYNSWSAGDERLSKIAPVIPGLRIIRQYPVECLFSFICSSNNNIPRIAKMLSSFRKTYGKKMISLPVRLMEDDLVSAEPLVEPMTIYSFPTLQQLKKATEQDLRDMGYGYRAKYIIQTRDLLDESGGEDFLFSLRPKDAEFVQDELIKFSGIGRKVADCVALFSLDQTEAVPVDVHVQHIASRDYDPTVLGQAKSLTPTIYKRVGDLFRDRFEYAGWAHSLLFVAELPSFRSVLPDDVVAEMDAVSIYSFILLYLYHVNSISDGNLFIHCIFSSQWKEAENARKAMEKEEKKTRSPAKK